MSKGGAKALKATRKSQPPNLPKKDKGKKANAPDNQDAAGAVRSGDGDFSVVSKPTTRAEIAEEKGHRAKSLEYTTRRAYNAAERPAPPSQLLTLIGIFLTDFGFNSTSRLFTNERQARKQLNGWEDVIGQKIGKGVPKLETIYSDWYRDWRVSHNRENTSAGMGDSPEVTSQGVNLKSRDSSQEESDTASSDSSSSDIKMKGTPKVKASRLSRKAYYSSSSSMSSSSDSDADDEEEKITKTKPNTIVKKIATSIPNQAVAAKPAAETLAKTLKRKAPDSSSESSSLDSDSSEDEVQHAPAKKAKTATNSIVTERVTTISKASQDSETSSSSDPSSSDSDAVILPKPTKATSFPSQAQGQKDRDLTDESSWDASSDSSSDKSIPAVAVAEKSNGVALPLVPAALSDSSVTINGDVKNSASIESNDDASSTDPSSESTKQSAARKSSGPAKKKPKTHQGAKPTPLAELSAKAAADSHISNKYQSYDYADKAYRDLSVTRGKGFTKEKNKKKRGSYRGGTIDISGEKASSSKIEENLRIGAHPLKHLFKSH